MTFYGPELFYNIMLFDSEILPNFEESLDFEKNYKNIY